MMTMMTIMVMSTQRKMSLEGAPIVPSTLRARVVRLMPPSVWYVRLESGYIISRLGYPFSRIASPALPVVGLCLVEVLLYVLLQERVVEHGVGVLGHHHHGPPEEALLGHVEPAQG
jgi:hypothetical protein